jgi:hypothetical protein
MVVITTTADLSIFSFMDFLFLALLCLQTEGARTQRALTRGTAKRPTEKHAKPRPMGRGLGRLSV